MPSKVNLSQLTPAERKELIGLLSTFVWLPHPSNLPQQQAYFSPAFEILYGGAAGGGKSDLLLGLSRTKHHRSLLLRRTYPDLERSLIARSLEFFGNPNNYNGTKHRWGIDGRIIEFGHMERSGTPTQPGDETQYASAQYDFIGFDQLEQFPQFAYEFMISRARTTLARQRVQIISTANPIGEGIDWIITRWSAWLDKTHPHPAKPGELRWYKRNEAGLEQETDASDPDALSRTFIPAGLKDNPYLGDDYRRQLKLLPEPLRSALLDGDWEASITDDAYQVIPRAWVKAAQARWTPKPPPGTVLDALGVDVARGGADKTVIAPKYDNYIASLEKYPGLATPDGQSVVILIQKHHLEGVKVKIDVIGVGASTYDIGKERFQAIAVNFSNKSTATDVSGKLRFVNARAEFWWNLRDLLEPTSGVDVALPPDPELLGDLTAPHWIPQSNGIKIEDKEEIKRRLGRSPDSGDAVVIAFAKAKNPTAEEWITALKRRTETEQEL